MICVGGVDANDPKFANQSIDQLVQDKQCAPYVYHSRSMLGRCIPSQVSRLMGNGTGQVRDETGKPILLMNAKNQEVNGMEVVKSRKLVLEFTTFFEKVVADLSQTWHVILVFSYDLSGTGFCFYRWSVLRKTTEGSNDLEFSLDIASYFRLASTWLALGIIFAILLVIILLILIFLRKRILVAIAILNEASKAVSTMTSVLFWPILPFILELIVIAQVLFVAISLRTISDPVGTKIINDDPTVTPGFGDKARNDIREIFQLIPCDPLQNNSAGKACRFLYYGDRKYTIYLQFFNLFMFFWLINFVKSLTQMTLAGTFAEYYFSSHNQKSSSKCPLITSLFRSTFYHTGSLAFGSFLIALLQWLRVTLEYINAKLKKANNPVTDFLLKCLSCCFWLLEKFLRFLNRNAFIMIAIYGQSFCSASRSALSLLARNVVRLFVVDKVTDFILFIGKLVVVSIVGGMAYVYLEGILFKGNDFLSDAFTSNLHYAFVPLGIIILASYLVASLFSSVFEMGVDTIFLCFLEDLEKNDGSAERPYYMSKNLMNILGKRNAQLPQIKQAI
ncbi:solute carrier family 44 (choline transporter-like protein), member 2/4/5 [Schistosoma bovis]|uniref:Choline transporter-like protein n=1 Tax=Schistosoma bovis TaxID=6184 RepID=A0A430QQ64_SCHBO|nr:solute carrier family 44 (choline transporter-like protein), member 2/4/5 [Schistosoma bovis]